MDRHTLEHRTKKLHISIIDLCQLLPKNAAGFEIGKQIIRSAGSVGANYRATKRAKSKADFIYKISIVLEEVDETHYWLEIIRDAHLIGPSEQLNELIKETNELVAIFSAVEKTSKEKYL